MIIKTFESGSSGNLHLIEFSSRKVLVECGLPMQKIMKYLDYNLDIDACLLSHYHKDHSKSANEIMRAGINLYCSRETADHLGLSGHRLKIIEKLFVVRGVDIYPFPTNHDTPGSRCFLMNHGPYRVLFATDSGSLPYRFSGMTHIMIECNWSDETIFTENQFVLDRTKKTHMSLSEVKKFLNNNDLSKVKEIRLIHLSNSNSEPEYFKREIQAITGKITIIS